MRHLATQRLEHLTSGALRAVDSDTDEVAYAEPVAVQSYSEAAWERARTVERVILALNSRRTPSRKAEFRPVRELGVKSPAIEAVAVPIPSPGHLGGILATSTEPQERYPTAQPAVGATDG